MNEGFSPCAFHSIARFEFVAFSRSPFSTRSSRGERKKLAQDKPYPDRSEGEEQSWEKSQRRASAP
jgi:hypothetical protein